MKKLIPFAAALALILCACGPILPGGSGESTPVEITGVVSTLISGTLPPFPTSEPPTPLPTLPSAALSLTQLKYKVLDQFPDFFYCDPDLYPIARDDEMSLALAQFPELQANQEEFQAILVHNGLSGTTFTDAQKLLIYRDHKKLNAIFFEPAGDKYKFQIQTGSEGQGGSIIQGTIDGSGKIDVLERKPGNPTCPICLAAGTRIDTPRGAVRVEDLRAGDPVWTVNAAGERVSAVVLKTGSVRVPASHQMVHLRLSDGREVWASPGHPSADGHALGSIKAGDILDGAQIVLAERVPYTGGATYDILPSGDTGDYWANGILLGSTLK
ncbi:MAG TPA: Hint domain-containing protein [Anaerolineales bacterium]